MSYEENGITLKTVVFGQHRQTSLPTLYSLKIIFIFHWNQLENQNLPKRGANKPR